MFKNESYFIQKCILLHYYIPGSNYTVRNAGLCSAIAEPEILEGPENVEVGSLGWGVLRAQGP